MTGTPDAVPEIGLTGSIGAGKSTAARLLRERGAVIVDADGLARAATEEPDVVAAIVDAFGPEVAPAGRLDRAALGARVFGDAAARERLEAIVHPRVAALREREVAAARVRTPRPPLIVHDVPLLYEAGLERAVDAVVVVDAPLDVRVRRVVARSGLDPDEVRRRDAAQAPAAEKRARADVVLSNAGEPDELARAIDEAWPALLRVPARRRG